MFKEMRKQERKISNLESFEILKKGEYGVLSVVNTNGYAYGVPLSYVFLNDNIYFHCAMEGSKLESIDKNNKVSFSVVGETEILPEKFSTKFESVIVFGKAAEAPVEEKEAALLGLIEKYSVEYLDMGKAYIAKAQAKTKVMKITIDHISGKARL